MDNMAAVALAPFLLEGGATSQGIVLTAVLAGGCQFACPYCFVSMRKDRSAKPEFHQGRLTDLVDILGRRNELSAVAIVGDEPLQGHTWQHAKEVLSKAERWSARSAIVSNGYELFRFTDELAELRIGQLLISLDNVGQRHDQMRRKQGAFEQIDRSLRRAMKYDELAKSVAIATVVMPQNLKELPKIVEYASNTGISTVYLSPLIQARRGQCAEVHPSLLRMDWSEIGELGEFAQELGVRLAISDELELLESASARSTSQVFELPKIRPLTPEAVPNLIRIDATGGLSSYDDIVKGRPPSMSLRTDDGAVEEVADRLIEQFAARPVEIAA